MQCPSATDRAQWLEKTQQAQVCESQKWGGVEGSSEVRDGNARGKEEEKEAGMDAGSVRFGPSGGRHSLDHPQEQERKPLASDCTSHWESPRQRPLKVFTPQNNDVRNFVFHLTPVEPLLGAGTGWVLGTQKRIKHHPAPKGTWPAA